jgi:hypothetical protein
MWVSMPSDQKTCHHGLKTAIKEETKSPTFSPAFFFWRNITTNGTICLGVPPMRMSFGMNAPDIFAFALPILDDFLELSRTN